MKTNQLEPKWVEFIPKELEEGIIYVSMTYATASHKCCCGCGIKVVTPLTKTDWKLTFDGTLSLSPSIGNWSLPCQSHYWIRNNVVEWAGRMSKERIDAGRQHDRDTKTRYYDDLGRTTKLPPVPSNTKPDAAHAPRQGFISSLWSKLCAFLNI